MGWYPHHDIEKKWQERWQKQALGSAKDFDKKQKAYILFEFPYPSGDGLHMGHLRSYTALDIIAREKRMEGKNVLLPIGWDAFGLPTENYALKTGKHPSEITKQNIENFRRQIRSLGYSVDWSREIDTTDPAYYKWTQWIFLQFFKHGLAYQATIPINWCPKDKIGLANEEVVDGKCERCGSAVVRKEQKQWMLKITAYADRLIDDLATVEYPERVKAQQIHWIGRSEGAEIDFSVELKANIKRFVILHGRASTEKDNFYPWLKKNLEEQGFEVQVPTLPNLSGEPDDIEQTDFVQKNFKLDKHTVIVGHSFGGIVAMRLAERGVKLGGIILVATPITGDFLDEKSRPTVTAAAKKGFDFEAIKANTDYIKVLCDIQDTIVPVSDGEVLAEKFENTVVKCVGTKPHFQGKEEPAVLDVSLPKIKVFTTRPDTIFGATYMVISPEHPLVQNYKFQITNYKEVEAYLERSKRKSDLDRTDLAKGKTGVELKGIKAINPATKEAIPIWIADYVLASYGTGAIMAVPAHDERDFEFAKKFGLEIRQVIRQEMNCIMVHGCPKDEKSLINIEEDTDKHWIPWIRKELSKLGSNVLNPLMPEAWHPHYEKWKVVMDAMPVDENSVLVGHSCGGAFLVRWLSENRKHIRKLILVAAAKIVADDAPKEKKLFYDFSIDPLLKNRIHETIVLIGEQDKERHRQSATMYAEALNGRLIELSDRGHFSSSDMAKTNAFPELLEEILRDNTVFVGEGTLINSDQFDGMHSKEAIGKITKWLEKEGVGNKAISYKLRDWVFSRQHYWGEPIPVIHCPDHGAVAVPDDQLPVELPYVEKYEPSGTGESPLATIPEFVNTTCPKCNKPAKRETDTMPNWAGSSWYYLRYCDPQNDREFAELTKLRYWFPVDLYNGGMEHTTLHLLYSRFWHKFLFDLKLVPESEPYKRRTSHGIILGEDGRKMSKSFGNVVNPDDLIKEYGADAVRTYEMFMGPFEDTIPWATRGIVGVHRFLQNVYDLFQYDKAGSKSDNADVTRELEFATHHAIKQVGDDIDSMRFNTAVSSLMQFVNLLRKHEEHHDLVAFKEAQKVLLILLAPFAPHLCSELWGKAYGGDISKQPWPTYDDKKLQRSEITLVVQVNGKVRAKVTVPADVTQDQALEAALAEPNVAKYVPASPKKFVFVAGRLINLITK